MKSVYTSDSSLMKMSPETDSFAARGYHQQNNVFKYTALNNSLYCMNKLGEKAIKGNSFNLGK